MSRKAASLFFVGSAAFLGMILFQNFSTASSTANPPRFGIADYAPWTEQPSAKIQQRFDYYQQIGIGYLWLDVAWNDQEVSDGTWRPPSNLNYMQLAQQSGLRLKADIGAINSPPAWFFQEHPDAQLVNQIGQVSANTISYWYPGLESLLESKDDALFAEMYNQNILNNISYLVIPFGPAEEALYPAPWTMGHPNGTPYFWFYDAHAQADFPVKMQLQYGSIAAANKAWGTAYASWSAVTVPNPGTVKGAMWNDVLTWYRDTKRSFVTWQIGHYKQLVTKYFPNGNAPPLVVLIPGQHIAPAEWQAAVASGGGDFDIIIMTDSEFLLESANSAGFIVEPDGLPEITEVAYLAAYMKANNITVPMWTQNAGGSTDMREFANETLATGGVGLEYINSQALFAADSVTPNADFTALGNAYAWLSGVWSGAITPTLTLEGSGYGALTLNQNECLSVDPAKTFQLCMQSDGNLVYYENTAPLWTSGTSGQNCSPGQCMAVFQGDGNFVVYSGTTPLWTSGTSLSQTSPYQAVNLIISTTQPYLKLLDANGDILWASANVFQSLTLNQGQFARFSKNSFLTMQGDGNLVLYQGQLLNAADAVWTSNTSGQNCGSGQCLATFQGDGNFVVYNGATALWTSNTSRPQTAPHVAKELVVSPDQPYLEILDFHGAILWQGQ